jgi:hypothetical protein
MIRYMANTEVSNLMMRQLIKPMLLGLLCLAFLSGCAGWMAGERRESNAEVILVSFGGTNAEISPCG